MLGRHFFRAAAVAGVVVAVVEGCTGDDPPLIINTGNNNDAGSTGNTGTSGGEPNDAHVEPDSSGEDAGSDADANAVGPLFHVDELSVGFSNACAIANGKLFCWGGDSTRLLQSDAGHQCPPLLGDGGNQPCSWQPVLVDSNAQGMKVGVGLGFACTLKDGKVACWGDTTAGQTGNDAYDASAPCSPELPVLPGTPSHCQSARVLVPGLDPVTEIAVAADAAHACALTAGGSVYCWGSNAFKEVTGTADGANVVRLPVLVPSLPKIAHIAVGGLYVGAGVGSSCAVGEDGRVFCWGRITEAYADAGAAGVVTAVPATSDPGSSAYANGAQVALGALQACIINVDRTISCFGEGKSGENVPGEQKPRAVPTPLNVGSVDHAYLGYGYSCVQTGTTVKCFGANDVHQLGDATSDGGVLTSTPQPKLRLFAAGTASSVGVVSETGKPDAVFAWGQNAYGVLGHEPSLVGDDTTCKAVATKQDTLCSNVVKEIAFPAPGN